MEEVTNGRCVDGKGFGALANLLTHNIYYQTFIGGEIVKWFGFI